jgi:hypothetical protein
MTDVFKEAARIIERNGHHKGGYHDTSAPDLNDCRVCVLGALSIAYFGFPDPYNAPREAVEQVQEFTHITNRVADHIGLPYDPDDIEASTNSVGDWNDEPERTEQDIIRVLDSIS